MTKLARGAVFMATVAAFSWVVSFLAAQPRPDGVPDWWREWVSVMAMVVAVAATVAMLVRLYRVLVEREDK